MLATDLPKLLLFNFRCSAPYLSSLEKPRAFLLPASTAWDTAFPQSHVSHPYSLLVRLSWLPLLRSHPYYLPCLDSNCYLLYWVHTYLVHHLLCHHGMLPWRKTGLYFRLPPGPRRVQAAIQVTERDYSYM